MNETNTNTTHHEYIQCGIQQEKKERKEEKRKKENRLRAKEREREVGGEEGHCKT